MEKIKLCRTIKPDGSLKEGSGIEIDSAGPKAAILQDVAAPFFSFKRQIRLPEIQKWPMIKIIAIRTSDFKN